MAEDHDHGAEHGEAAEEPRAGHLDAVHGIVAAAALQERGDGAEGAHHGLPVHEEQQQAGGHHHGNAGPQAPGGDLAEARGLDHAEPQEVRREDHVIDERSEQHAPRLAEADDRAHRDEQQRALERHGELVQLVGAHGNRVGAPRGADVRELEPRRPGGRRQPDDGRPFRHPGE